MKVFVVALCVFVILLGVIVANSIFVRRVTHTMATELQEMAESSDPTASFARLESIWQKNRTRISVSVAFGELRDMDECLAQMRVALVLNDESEFKLAHSLACETVDHMGRLERFSWECII